MGGARCVQTSEEALEEERLLVSADGSGWIEIKPLSFLYKLGPLDAEVTTLLPSPTYKVVE